MVSRLFQSAPHRAGRRCDFPILWQSHPFCDTNRAPPGQVGYPMAAVVQCADLQGAGGTLPSPWLRKVFLGVGSALGHPEGARAPSLSLTLSLLFPLQAPAPAKGKEEIVALNVSIQGDSLSVSEAKKVMLRALNPGIFIQTDKAVYKPGQEGEGGRRDHPALGEAPGGEER